MLRQSTVKVLARYQNWSGYSTNTCNSEKVVLSRVLTLQLLSWLRRFKSIL